MILAKRILNGLETLSGIRHPDLHVHAGVFEIDNKQMLMTRIYLFDLIPEEKNGKSVLSLEDIQNTLGKNQLVGYPLLSYDDSPNLVYAYKYQQSYEPKDSQTLPYVDVVNVKIGTFDTRYIRDWQDALLCTLGKNPKEARDRHIIGIRLHK